MSLRLPTRTLSQLLVIAGLVVAATLATWLLMGTPDRSVPCGPASLKAGEICLETVLKDWNNDVVWIDARRRVDWEKDGLKGSLLVTTADGDSFDKLLEQAFPRLSEGKKVVVYCSDIGCGTSLEIAKRIRDFQLVPDVRALHGGWKALQQAGLVKTKP